MIGKDFYLSLVAIVAMVSMTLIEHTALMTDQDGAFIAPYMTALGAIVGAVGGYIYGKRVVSEISEL